MAQSFHKVAPFMFGEKLRPVADFLPRVMIHIDGVDMDLATTYIMDSIIHFARETKILSETVCIDLEPCRASYKIHTKRRRSELLFAKLFINGHMQNTDEFAYRVDGDTLYTPEIPPCGDYMMELTFATVPDRDTLEVPDIFYEDWVEAIVALTLSKLYLLTDNEWYNPQAAASQLQIYQQQVNRAMIVRITRHKPLRMRLKNKRRF